MLVGTKVLRSLVEKGDTVSSIFGKETQRLKRVGPSGSKTSKWLDLNCFLVLYPCIWCFSSVFSL